MENAQKVDQEEDSNVQASEVDLDSMSDVVEDSLKTANELAMRLGELNREMIDYMYNYAQARASNRWVIHIKRKGWLILVGTYFYACIELYIRV